MGSGSGRDGLRLRVMLKLEIGSGSRQPSEERHEDQGATPATLICHPLSPLPPSLHITPRFYPATSSSHPGLTLALALTSHCSPLTSHLSPLTLTSHLSPITLTLTAQRVTGSAPWRLISRGTTTVTIGPVLISQAGSRRAIRDPPGASITSIDEAGSSTKGPRR